MDGWVSYFHGKGKDGYRVEQGNHEIKSSGVLSWRFNTHSLFFLHHEERDV